ncbi:HNH endonuclease signature motif containing protein [Methylobacterium sp. CCH5-D2]|uniref:HNH endonuclease n=1 Tax=Methylobacterium sp. CCH5-D2 TaxID=1768765 RepID=UPI00082B143F|nr:HNH endonuclease signature motif containing protein [Methylobacterium sp. CCH5-D2]
MPRREFTKATQRAAFKRANGQCEGVLHTGLRCEAVVEPGRVEFDHVIPDALGGDNSLENCAALCRLCHRAKTTKDQGRIAKADRQSDRHIGVKDPHRRRLTSAGFTKAEPQRRASTPLSKPPVVSLIGRRNTPSPNR